jgi:hypothetical protein
MESELMLSILVDWPKVNPHYCCKQQMAIPKRFQNGTYKIACSPYGYDAVNGELVVNKSQAEVDPFIFSEIFSAKAPTKLPMT